MTTRKLGVPAGKKAPGMKTPGMKTPRINPGMKKPGKLVRSPVARLVEPPGPAPVPLGLPTPEDTSKLLLTVKEAAYRLQMCERRMWTLVGRGIVRSVKDGRLRRVPVSALDEYVGTLARVSA